MKKIIFILIILFLLLFLLKGIFAKSISQEEETSQSIFLPLVFDNYRSPSSQKIVFSSDKKIYTMNPDGSNQIKLTDNSCYNLYPKWSPDGSKIVFSSNCDGDFEIFVMNFDGTSVKQLTNNSSLYDVWPAWSPDGSKIAFVSNRIGLNQKLYIMNSDGSAKNKFLQLPVTIGILNGHQILKKLCLFHVVILMYLKFLPLNQIAHN